MAIRFTVDSNILVYAADADAGPRHRAAVALLDRALDEDCVLLAQTLAEFYRAATRKGRAAPANAALLVRGWLDAYATAPWTEADLRAALDLSARDGLAFFDALIVATARRVGCAVLLTEEMQDGRRVGGVEIVNPFRPGAVMPWRRPAARS